MAQEFTNKQMTQWMGFLTDVGQVGIDKVKILDNVRNVCNVLPAIEMNQYVLIFTGKRDKGLFYDIWEAGHEECDVFVGYGLEPNGDYEKKKVRDLIDDEIVGPTVVLVYNQNAHESYKIGIENDNFARGPIHYVGNEIRAVIMTMMGVDSEDRVLLVNAESIVVEAAMMAPDGKVIAVEPDPGSEASMRENVEKFGVRNVEIVKDVREETLADLPAPRLSFIVASDKLEEQIRDLIKKNPHMQFIVYTLELDILSGIRDIFQRNGIKNMRVTQITVAKTDKASSFVTQPTPWLIRGER
ncbi:MAG: Precorrin-6B methylase 2 [Eubacterium sp.]|nr:Precorrin-6B methylase 2 [Eubacterium sp.]